MGLLGSFGVSTSSALTPVLESLYSDPNMGSEHCREIGQSGENSKEWSSHVLSRQCFLVMSKALSFIGRIWSNGEFGISRERTTHIEPTRRIDFTDEQRWGLCLLKVHGLWECITFARFLRHKESHPASEYGEYRATAPGLGANLDSSMVTNSHRRPRGQKGISRYGGKLVRNGAFVMERDFQRSRLSFLTLTIPNVSVGESKKLSEHWSEVVRVFCQRLRRALRGKRLPGEIVGVTEVQEKRAAMTGVFGLHLHMVFVGRKRKHGWALTPAVIKEMWKSALKKYLDNPEDSYDWRAVENIQQVKKSASAYLGKYLSKGFKSAQKLRALFPDVKFPSNWYICTTEIRKCVKREQIHLQGELGVLLADMCESNPTDLLAFRNRIDIKLSDGTSLPIGWSGRLTGEGKLMFADFAKEVKSFE